MLINDLKKNKEEQMMGRLQGRVAFVTGASRGIGKATAKLFAEEGARVCLVDIDEQAVKQAAKELQQAGFDVFAAKVDVTSREQVESAINETVSRYDRLDILINNAGVIRDNLLFKMTDEDWNLVMDVHLKGAFYCSRAAQKWMVEQKYGRMINLSSTSALGNRGQANYAAAKAGMQGLTKTLAIELGKFGITVNAVAPGFIETAMTRATAERLGISFETFLDECKKEIPVGRTGKPEDIAHAILFFAQEEASFVNGQILYVAGGPKD
jgi:3-oxoacyl-[acyl-carrier protein] reductase